jgi:hypothetical protein
VSVGPTPRSNIRREAVPLITKPAISTFAPVPTSPRVATFEARGLVDEAHS